MNDKLQNALDSVETTYHDLVEIANQMLAPLFDPINETVNRLNYSINALSVDQIRDYILDLQLKAFSISETKEKAALKAELAEAIQKEQYAIKFNGIDGSAAVKDKLATVAVSQEVVAETLYNLVSNLLRTKLDQLHRLVDALKSILMSRMQETKFMNNLGASSNITTVTEEAKTGVNF